MLYKFKSKVTGDLIMLEPDAKRMLKIMDREDQVKGIFLAEQIPQAIAALHRERIHRPPAGWHSRSQIDFS